MAANLTIDKIFADNLGTAFGGCVRDQSLNLFSPEIARSAGANWNPLPFFGRAEKVRFRARWAALLQGIGLWAALVVIPELKADPKLSRKITSQMEAYTDALLKAPILDHLSPERSCAGTRFSHGSARRSCLRSFCKARRDLPQRTALLPARSEEALKRPV